MYLRSSPLRRDVIICISLKITLMNPQRDSARREKKREKRRRLQKNIFRHVRRAGMCCGGLCRCVCFPPMAVKEKLQSEWACVFTAVGDWPHVPDSAAKKVFHRCYSTLSETETRPPNLMCCGWSAQRGYFTWRIRDLVLFIKYLVKSEGNGWVALRGGRSWVTVLNLQNKTGSEE